MQLISAVFLDSAEKQVETCLVVRNLRSWSHALTHSGSVFAGAVVGAGPLLHRMVNDGHKELRERGRGKAGETEGREAEVIPAVSSRQAHLVLLFCTDSF